MSTVLKCLPVSLQRGQLVLADLQRCSAANRLDRLVSGVILIATNKASAQALGKDFGTPGRVKKVYVARVTGNFPQSGAVPVTDDPSLHLEAGEVVCDEPLLTIDKQIGVNVVHADGRVSSSQ